MPTFDKEIRRRGSRLPNLAASATLLLGGCVSFSPDGGLSVARDIARAELGQEIVKVSSEAGAAAAQAHVERLLKGPLTAEKAVAIALLNNRGLQAAYNELGISEAQFIEDSLPPNPLLAVTKVGGDFSLEIERQLIADLLSLATLPARRAIAADQFRAAQLRAALATLRFAADARRQYYRAVAANQQGVFLQQARLSNEALAELATKLGETGALNKLEQAREQALYAEIAGQLARAKVQQRIERERLTRLLGLWGRDTNFTLPGSLPPLPRTIRTARDVEAQALRRRVDLQIARAELDALSTTLGLTRATRFINVFELGAADTYEREKTIEVNDGRAELSRDKKYRRGFDLALEIPIWDFGQARTVEAEQTYMQAANLFAQKAVNIRSQAREAYQAYRGTYDIVRLYDREIIPLRKIIEELSSLQFTGMQIDVSRLILDVRGRILSNVQAIEARRDFWIAETDLRTSLAGGGPGGSSGVANAMESAAADSGQAE